MSEDSKQERKMPFVCFYSILSRTDIGGLTFQNEDKMALNAIGSPLWQTWPWIWISSLWENSPEWSWGWSSWSTRICFPPVDTHVIPLTCFSSLNISLEPWKTQVKRNVKVGIHKNKKWNEAAVLHLCQHNNCIWHKSSILKHLRIFYLKVNKIYSLWTKWRCWKYGF